MARRRYLRGQNRRFAFCVYSILFVFVKQPPMECSNGVKNKDLMCYNRVITLITEQVFHCELKYYVTNHKALLK